MRVLITGSAGFIGYHLAERLLAQGAVVAGVDDMNPYYDVALKQARHARLARYPGFSAHIQDVADRSALAALFATFRPELVIHLAAQAGVRHALIAPQDYLHSNVEGSFSVLEACRLHPPRHLLMASTSSVYGASTRIPFTEDDPADTPLNIYAASKRAMELIAHSHAHLWRLPVTAFRFFTVYGPWGRPDMALFTFTRRILAGEPIALHGHGEMERDFTYIDDLVEAVLRLAERPPQGAGAAAPFRIVNIGGGRPVRLADFLAEVERGLGRQAQRQLVPALPGELRITWADPSRLRALTGYVPQTPISVGVPAFLRWYREFYGV
ncbi:MAG: NAD-dependent epimerase/dehydratase family protein [Rhodovarius sp.]|nr:NAD-dependent epimerase/dehydratase family protein [Rhodovarius sp.]MDW8313326.1 NAD-dependent epimerase/dehydratase family protein [Rhodovarius sp.]